jgi:ATP synthase protein I
MVRRVPAAFAAGAVVAWLHVRMSKGRPPDPLARLGERIDRARSERARSEPVVADRSALQQGLGSGFRIGIELVVAVAVATAVGWAIDHWLGTRPWGMIVLFFLGVAAGMLNVYRAVTGLSAPVGYRQPNENSTAAPQAGNGWDDDEN